MRLFGGARRCSPRRRARPALCGRPAFQALLKRIHQADDVIRPLLALGHLDRLAGGLAPDQRLQRILVLVLLANSIMSFDIFGFRMSSKYSSSSRTS